MKYTIMAEYPDGAVEAQGSSTSKAEALDMLDDYRQGARLTGSGIKYWLDKHAQENPLSSNEKIALGVAAAGVVGLVAYLALRKPSSSSSTSNTSMTAAQIAKAAAQGGAMPSPNPPPQKPPILAQTPQLPPNQLQQAAQQLSQVAQSLPMIPMQETYYYQ